MMKPNHQPIVTLIIIAVLVAWSSSVQYAQERSPTPAPVPQDPTTTPTPKTPEANDDEVLRFNTSLVNIAVSVLDRDGKFVSRLSMEDFRVDENGVEQQIAHFAPVEQPFTVFLVLDTSESTLFRLVDMQEAAITFVEELRPDDRVMVISFSNFLTIKSEPTNDREALRLAIRRTNTGGGTSLYPAVDFIFNRVLKRVPGRKAVVLFTDGADSGARNRIETPDRATYKSTLHQAEEADALIYPIRYDTLQSMLDRNPQHEHRQIKRSYKTAGDYLAGLAVRTGGEVLRADSLPALKLAFSRIAEVLRWQYSLGYYPSEAAAKGERRSLKVKVRRRDLKIRSRDSYVRQ